MGVAPAPFDATFHLGGVVPRSLIAPVPADLHPSRSAVAIEELSEDAVRPDGFAKSVRRERPTTCDWAPGTLAQDDHWQLAQIESDCKADAPSPIGDVGP